MAERDDIFGDLALQCPVPVDLSDAITLAHGGGGTLMHRLIRDVFAAGLADPALQHTRDAALLDIGEPGGRLAFTTDSYVVSPLFFPGGDIGTLAVHGTVNDLAMVGARPQALSASFLLEEGCSIATVERVVASMREAARRADVHIVTGDTKVVERGKADGVFINTAGIGAVRPGLMIGPERVQPGDRVLVSGDLGRHGMAILSVREGLAFETTIESDCAPLSEPVARLLDAGIDVRCMRDATRGGLASAVIEIAHAAGVAIELQEPHIPVADNVRAACELLGLDPLYVANEGRFVAFVAERDAAQAERILREHPITADARTIGQVSARDSASSQVTLRTSLGARRVLDMLSGEALPRIC